MPHTTRSQTEEPVPIRGEWLGLLLLAQIACAPDVTAPQGAAAVDSDNPSGSARRLVPGEQDAGRYGSIDRPPGLS